MEMNQLKCTCCGANLQVPSNASRFNCSFCGTSFSVKSQDGADEHLGMAAATVQSAETLYCDYCGGQLNPSDRICRDCGQMPTILVKGEKLSRDVELDIRYEHWDLLWNLTLKIENDHPASAVAWASKGLANLHQYLFGKRLLSGSVEDISRYFEMAEKTSAKDRGFVRELFVKASDLCMLAAKREWNDMVNGNLKYFGQKDAWERYGQSKENRSKFDIRRAEIMKMATWSVMFDPNKKAELDALANELREALAIIGKAADRRSWFGRLLG